uniref:Uncharacterized protein n=1 Tax=Helicotheca tamesis TaxID=374047 RepID=A0A7S2HG92_9STRA|mmetsp:Transcript_17569/g.24214  ORF Transcript_17569/g.24214 Transcript_17569/m.24214 type:complete len:121 (+) Transcript_17569:347-709(+)
MEIPFARVTPTKAAKMLKTNSHTLFSIVGTCLNMLVLARFLHHFRASLFENSAHFRPIITTRSFQRACGDLFTPAAHVFLTGIVTFDVTRDAAPDVLAAADVSEGPASDGCFSSLDNRGR